MDSSSVNIEASARIFRIESLNTHNGPGYRTVIYIKGCPLNCLWCHNPESISAEKEIWVLHSKCMACLSCVSVCPNNALSAGENGIEVNRDICTGCYTCADNCPSKAIEKIGEDQTVSGVFDRIMKDKVYMDTSGGGVTVTGGEPGIAPEFVAQLFKKCREVGIHTAFDTSGFISAKALEMIIPFTDLVFFDLKLMDEERAREMTGQGTSRIFESLDRITEYRSKTPAGPELQFRTPVIPGATDSDENINAIIKLLREKYKGLFTEWELNFFNDICEDKYQRLGKEWYFEGAKLDNDDYLGLEALRNINPDLKIRIAGYVQK